MNHCWIIFKGYSSRRRGWRITEQCLVVILYITLLVLESNCQTIIKNDSNIKKIAKTDNIDNKLSNLNCHNCHISNSSNNVDEINKFSDDNEISELAGKIENVFEDTLNVLSNFTHNYIFKNSTKREIKNAVEGIFDDALNIDKYEIIDGVEINSVATDRNMSLEKTKDTSKGRGLFDSYTYEYRLLNKIKNFIDTHVLSINLPKVVGFRSFGLKKFFLPLLIGAQVFKSILLAMFLPSILGSFGKMVGKGISQVSAASSQASYPPANGDDQISYNQGLDDTKDVMGYESDPAGSYAYPNGLYVNMGDQEQDGNDLSNMDMRFGSQKNSFMPTKNGYYKNQLSASNNYKVFQKIPASSMILSNYDPFYSPLLSRLDGIFARLGLVPPESSTNDGPMIGGQTVRDVKLEACREQLICLMYNSPAKYAPYSNLVSAQLSRELNELRRPVSDNPEILRFFRYMKAARRGQEGIDCMRAFPTCAVSATPEHTMIAAYHDINKLVTARKLSGS